MPRRNRSSPENNANLNLTYEKTLGTVGGIRAEASLEADLGDTLGLKANRLNGSFDAGDRTASINAGLGSKAAKSGASVEGTIKLGEDGRIEAIGGGVSGRVLGFGGGISGDSQGNTAISGEAFGGKIEVSRDKNGNFAVQVCYGLGPFEACTTFARDQGDPQNEGSLKLGGGIKPGTDSRRPNTPNLPPRQPIRRPPVRSRTQPEPPPRPQPDRPVKPHQDKKPNPPKKPTPKPKADIKRTPVKPAPPKKKPRIDLKKKPQINLQKPKANIRRRPPKPPLKPKEPSPKPQPINLKKPVTPSPNLTKPLRPTPSPKIPKPPRPTPSPQPPKPTPVPRPNPWPRIPPVPKEPEPIIPGDPLPPPIANKQAVPGDPAVLAIVNILSFSYYYYNGVPWECGGQWMNNHLGVTSSSEASVFGEFDPRDIPGDIKQEQISLYSSRRVNIKSTGQGTLTECSRLDFDYDYWGLKARECVTDKRRRTETYAGRIMFRDQVSSGKGGISYSTISSYLVDSSSSSEATPGATRTVSAYTGPNLLPILVYGKLTAINAWFNSLNDLPNNRKETNNSIGEGNCGGVGKTQRYFQYIVGPFITPQQPYLPPRLPNQPTKIKPMNCCDKINEIYKYLGIAKLKKNKFPVSKAFLSPGGTGNENCEDYYQLNQALFRMLANGLILNPKASPHGNPWQSVNATAWAGNVYEMVAEAMSNGDSTQKFEIAMAMQVTQLLQIIAEQTRKIEFLSECLGIEPDLDVEEVPACFTIYEGHKGFDPNKKPEKIDITKAKTDEQVEETLTKMLQPSKVPIVKWVFKPDSKSIVRILRDE